MLIEAGHETRHLHVTARLGMDGELNDLALSTVELFAGVGMLGEGLRAGLDYLDIPHRTVCYVEREAHAAAVLVARMEEGSLDAAAVWSDVTTFPARRFRGKVDGIVAGFPCQDISVAGRRKGLDGQRSGLFFEIPRIADDCGAWFLFLENVAGISSATATVMDEAEGELDERAAARVVGELADLGWHAEWIVVSAADVGASHGRARWFCLAWRDMADAQHHAECAEQRTESRQREDKGPAQEPEHRVDGGELGNAGLQHRELQQRNIRTEHPRAGDELANAECGQLPESRRGSQGRDGFRSAEPPLGNAESDGRNEGRAESGWQQGRSDVAEHGRSMADATSDCRSAFAGLCTRQSKTRNDGSTMADTGRPGSQGPELGRACNSDRGGAENTWIS